MLAHEMAHVVQQRGGTPGTPAVLGVDAAESQANQAAAAAMRGAPMPPLGAASPSRALSYDPNEWHPPMLPPTFVAPPPFVAPSRLGVPVTVTFPSFGETEGSSEELVFDLELGSSHDIQYFVVRRQVLRRTAPAAPVGTVTPPTTSAATTPGGAAPSLPTSPPPAPAAAAPAGTDDRRRVPIASTAAPTFEVGQVVYTPAAEPIEILALSGDYVVTDRMTSYAVGAGSVKFFEGPNGPVLIDAGIAFEVGSRTDPVLAARIADDVASRLGGRPLVEIAFTHLHLDHIALIGEIFSRVQVQGLRMNIFQALANDGAGVRRLVDRIRDSLRARITEELGTEGGPWDAEIDPEERGRMRTTEIEARLAARMAVVEATPVHLSLPVDGRLQTSQFTLGTVRQAARGIAIDTAQLLGPEVTPHGMVLTASPELGAAASDAQGSDAQRSALLDRYSTSMVVEMGGAEFLVLSDLRARDLVNVQENFQRALGLVDRSASFRLWDMTHHMQSGFAGTTANLVEATRVLHQIAAAQTPGLAAGDAVIVSADLRMIDPATIYILRSLGFDVFMAAAGSDVHLLEVELGGERIGGLVAQDYEGAAPGDPLLRRAQAALAELDARLDAFEEQRASQGEDAALEAERQRVARQRAEIATAHRAFIDAVRSSDLRQSGGRPSATAQPRVAPSPGADVAAGAGQALRELLTDFDRPVVGETPRFVDSALVVMDRTDLLTGRPGPEAAGLSASRSVVRVLQARWNGGQRGPEVRFELVAALEVYRSGLRAALEDAPRGTREILTRHLELASSGIEALTNTESTITLNERQPGSGQITQTRVNRFDRWADGQTERMARRIGESRAARAMRGSRLAETRGGQWAATRGHELVERGMHQGGRVLGSFMVYQTIRGQAELLDRLVDGNANPLEALAGTAYNAQGLSVGVRMARGIPVRGGAFVVLAILDVAQTAADTRAVSDEEYWADLSTSVVRNALHLALFYMGSALIGAAPETGPFAPVVALAGLAVMFLAEPIMELFGIDDAINRAWAFEPGDVWDVGTELPELMDRYRHVVGALELAARSDTDLAALGFVAGPQAVRDRAEASRVVMLARAHDLEGDILEEFQEGYDTAETEHVGLMALDIWRREFTQLRYRAHGDSVEPEFNQQLEAIEADLSMSGLLPSQVMNLDLWDDIDSEIADVESELDPFWGTYDWPALQSDVQQLQRVMQNARYRVEPRSFGGMRSEPVLSPDDLGYSTYMTLLAGKESRYFRLMDRVEGALGARLPAVCRAPRFATDDTQLGSAIDSADTAVFRYSRLVESHTRLPAELSVEALYTNSGDAGFAYGQHLASDEGYRNDLTALQIQDGIVRERMREAQRLALGSGAHGRERLPDLMSLALTLEQLQRRRREELGYLFPQEAARLQGRIREVEVSEIGAAFGATPETPRLSDNEMSALRRDALGGLDYHSLLNNLERIPALRRGAGAAGQLGGIYTLAGPPAGRLAGVEARLGHPRRGDDIIVGSFETPAMAPRRYITGYGWVDLHVPDLLVLGAAVAAGTLMGRGVQALRLGGALANAIDIDIPTGLDSVQANLFIETVMPSIQLATLRQATGTRLVIPLNDSAVDFFRRAYGSAGARRVYDTDLSRITLEQVRTIALGEEGSQ